MRFVGSFFRPSSQACRGPVEGSDSPVQYLNMSSRRIRVLAAALAAILVLLPALSGCAGSSGSSASSDAEVGGTAADGADGGEEAEVSTPAGQESAPEEDGTLETVFFDVGKGDCILISMGGEHILVDAGYEETSDDILEDLQSRGISALDAMVITHYDKDHVGGAAEIASEIPVGTFYLPDYTGDTDKCGDLLTLIQTEDLQAVRVNEEKKLSVGSAQLLILPALVAYDPLLENDNDASLIVEVFYGDDAWLLPGDIEEEAIDAWLAVNTEEFDVLKMPHHGRKEKNSKDLIKNVSPSIAVITDSDEDQASDKVLKKLEKEDAEIYRSSTDGTITVTGRGEDVFEVETQQ